jgi:hypothetical protein
MPALATTTAMVVGAVGIEVIKYLNVKKNLTCIIFITIMNLIRERNYKIIEIVSLIWRSQYSFLVNLNSLNKLLIRKTIQFLCAKARPFLLVKFLFY